MDAIRRVQVFAVLATTATGLFSMLAPRKVAGFNGLEPIGERGITEIRAVLGGLFIALGLTPLFAGPTAFSHAGHRLPGDRRRARRLHGGRPLGRPIQRHRPGSEIVRGVVLVL